jgi:hypothetical protein
MHFIDQLKDGNQIREYEAVLVGPAHFVEDCARFVTDAFVLAQQRTFPEQKYYHGTIILLMRHVVEAVDGVSLLVAKGSAENCGPLLRSAFEALVGILYILKDDTERRALAYQVAHAHKKIKFYRKFIPTDDVGRNLRAELKDDQFVKIFDQPGVDWQRRIDGLRGMFAQPEFAPIHAEWERVKKGKKGTGTKDPNWYALFGGPGDLRGLTLRVGKGTMYEILYRHWSDFTHAGGAFGNISADANGGVAVEPVRSPEGIERICNLACSICTDTVMAVVQKFASDEWPKFQQRYIAELRPRHIELLKNKVVTINWESKPPKQSGNGLQEVATSRYSKSPKADPEIVQTDKDIIDRPLIDQNLDSYEQFFDHRWSEHIFKTVKTSPLNDAVCALLVSWRFTNGAHLLPWLMAHSLKRFAESEGNGSLRFRGEYSSEVVKGIVNKLESRMQYSLKREQRATLKRVVAKIEQEAFEGFKAAQSKAVFPLDGYWKFLIHTSEFQLSILGTQRINYGSLFFAYEDFLANVIRTKEPTYSSKKKPIKDAFADHFGEPLRDYCWSDPEVELAKLVRHALAHNGGRFGADLEKDKTRFEYATRSAEPTLRDDLFILVDGKIQITPGNTKHLFGVLKERVTKIVEELV